MNAKFEIDPALLDDAVELMRFAMDRCEADAVAFTRMDAPDAKELDRQRLAMAKKAETLLVFFAQQ